ncbi:MAG: SCO family protein [Opitutaceae bacterium]
MKTYAVVASVVLMVVGCSRPENAASTGEKANPSVAAATGSYPLTGEILSVDAPRKVLIVKHEDIPGYMPAMTMEFVVSDADLAAAKPGQRIRAEMTPAPDSVFRLGKIWPNDKAGDDTITAGARVLRQDTHSRGRNVYREVGETVPVFALYDQEGRVVQSAQFRGKKVMLNFIFTRCPVATMCPAATLKMVSAQKLAKEAGVSNVEFISVTLDPTYDTPPILKEYAKLRGIDTANFSFLTGPDKAIKDLLAQFGVIAEFENDLLKHTLTTLLIDENGTIIHRADSSVWEAGDFVAKMRKS